MISGSRQPALTTLMPALAQRFGRVRSACAGLRRATRVNFHQRAPSFCRFVREFGDESRPSGIRNGPGEQAGS